MCSDFVIQIDHKTFHMNIVDMKRFEEKLREAERNLGLTVDNGVPIIYERSSDTAGKLLASLIVVGLLLSVLSRSKSIRPPISMDTFVCSVEFFKYNVGTFE